MNQIKSGVNEKNNFRKNSTREIKNKKLQDALSKIPVKFIQTRTKAVNEFGDFEALREAGAKIRDSVIHDLSFWLLRFEENAKKRNITVHWAKDGDEACKIVNLIAKKSNVKTAVKTKSMVSEEIKLNRSLAEAGIEVIETDLGEYVAQLAGDAPSHIIAPILHKNRKDVADLFELFHARNRTNPDWKNSIEGLCKEARDELRPKFLNADMGITGANFLVAETGSVVLVTNEGNGRLSTTLPPVLIAITGIEKVIPQLDDVATLTALLTRSATGQTISNYISILTGPKDINEHEGPKEMHVILLDNGRSDLTKSRELISILRCIRCGACMNHCPVYQAIGGHAYNSVYSGPMGSILSPTLNNINSHTELPHASTLCGQCEVVCPVKIPLPEMLRSLREKHFANSSHPFFEKFLFNSWGYIALNPKLYLKLTSLGIIALSNTYLIKIIKFITREKIPIPTLDPIVGYTFQNKYNELKRNNDL